MDFNGDRFLQGNGDKLKTFKINIENLQVMKKINYTTVAGNVARSLFLLTIILMFFTKVKSQICDPLVTPALFGQSQTFIFCKGNQIGFGVIYSDTAQDYTFSVYNNGATTAKKAGPLTGNGGQLSVSAFMLSARDAGQYNGNYNQRLRRCELNFFSGLLRQY